MSEKETTAAVMGGKKSDGNISLSATDLQNLITAAVSAAVTQASQSSAQILADAITKSREPYKSPATKANEDAMRASSRELRERIDKSIQASRESCPHLQGSNPLSEFQGQLSSFVFHMTDTGETIGLCTNCLKSISSLNPADRALFGRKSANKMSMAGRRTFVEPLKVQQRGSVYYQEMVGRGEKPEPAN